jgi:hypothetical protein
MESEMNEIHLTAVEVVSASHGYRRRSRAERHAMAFIARYPVEHTREAYGTGLRQFFAWCDEAGIEPLDATWKEIELFARTLEQAGRKPATVASRLNVLAGFYKYAHIDGLIEENPMVFVSRPKIQRTSTTLGLTRTEFADVLNAADSLPVRDHALICLLGLNGLRVSRQPGSTSKPWAAGEDNEPCVSTARAASSRSSRSRAARPGWSTSSSPIEPVDPCSSRAVASAWIDAAPPALSPVSSAGRTYPSGSRRTASGTRSSPWPSTPANVNETSPHPPDTPIAAWSPTTTATGKRSPATPPTRSPLGVEGAT